MLFSRSWDPGPSYCKICNKLRELKLFVEPNLAVWQQTIFGLVLVVSLKARLETQNHIVVQIKHSLDKLVCILI